MIKKLLDILIRTLIIIGLLCIVYCCIEIGGSVGGLVLFLYIAILIVITLLFIHIIHIILKAANRGRKLIDMKYDEQTKKRNVVKNFHNEYDEYAKKLNEKSIKLNEKSIEPCQNCGRPIGKLEQAYVWQEHIICKQCNNYLKNP
jgi:ribosomal protein L37AE/L43A